MTSIKYKSFLLVTIIFVKQFKQSYVKLIIRKIYRGIKMENKEIFSKSALKALIIPLLVEQVLAVTVGLSDVMMVSNVGEAAISGVSLVDMI